MSMPRAVASMYSWGGGSVGKNFRMTKKMSEDVCYPENEDAIYKQKYAYFTHRHITNMLILKKLGGG
jgi:hypothetical protein